MPTLTSDIEKRRGTPSSRTGTWLDKFLSKRRTAAEAAKVIRGGDCVYIHPGCAEPEQLVKAMVALTFVTGMLPVFQSALAATSPFWTSPAVGAQRANITVALAASEHGVAAAQRYGYSPYYNAIRASAALNKMVSDVVMNQVPPERAAADAASSIQQTIAARGD